LFRPKHVNLTQYYFKVNKSHDISSLSLSGEK
jgi:hypothetical protein